jgi:Holliday junction resolvase
LAAEKACARELRAKGYQATLSAGSRGHYDVIAINAEEILLIQVKATRALVRRAEPRVLRKLQRAPAPPAINIRKQLWALVDGHGWVITEVQHEASGDSDHR